MARAGRVALVFVVVATSSGCYLMHGREDAPVVGRDAAAPPRVWDGGARGVDAGTRGRDAGGGTRPMDAGPRMDAAVLPEMPDPDLGPESRPSDYVDAGEWREPPEIGADEACCTLGEPILITSRDLGMALAHVTPSIAWGPDRWGLLATRHFLRGEPKGDPQAIVFELAADGAPLGPPVVLDSSSHDPGGIAWAEGRWAIALSRDAVGGDVREWETRLYDRDLRPATDWMAVGPARVFQIALARLTVGSHWEAVRGEAIAVHATPFNGAGVQPAAELDREPAAQLAAVGMRSRLAVLVGREPPTASELIVHAPPPDHRRLGSVTLRAPYATALALAGVRDRVVAVGIDTTGARAEVVDPFDTRAVGDVIELGTAATGLWSTGAIDVSGSDKLGLAGVCWSSRVGDGTGGRDVTSWIDFRLIGPDGRARGRAVRVVDSPFRAGTATCSVGADDRGFLVAWWNGSELWVRRVEPAR